MRPASSNSSTSGGVDLGGGRVVQKDIGDQFQRDSAYHQGTVWTWLLGHFAIAHERVYGDRKKIESLFKPIEQHLQTAAIITISEIFDADPPHNPKGCIAQAWSVAALMENLILG